MDTVMNAVKLASVEDSKIVNISLYTGRAEVTRLFKFEAKEGSNEVHIVGLPNSIEKDSLRVEGRGSATIHEVTLSDTPIVHGPSTSDEIEGMVSKQRMLEKALERCKKSQASLEKYLATLSTEHTNVSQLQSIVEGYDTAAEKLDNRISELENEIRQMEGEVRSEMQKLSQPAGNVNPRLRKKATIGVVAEDDTEVQLLLIYGINNASWDAKYDIRVDLNHKDEDKPVRLVYKGGITQNTGEDWSEVPLTLETATPTFGLTLPTLTSWNLSLHRPMRNRRVSGKEEMMRAEAAALPDEESDDDMGFGLFDDGPVALEHRQVNVTSKGSINATFRVPGKISVPSDAETHNVTIAQLTLDAQWQWMAIPKKDTRVHLTARIHNDSDYTLLRGPASIYVDGSFISKTSMSSVSPQEHFDCPLGLDTTIRITYPPVKKKNTTSGFYSRSSTTMYSQRVIVENTKTIAVDGLKIVDQMPVSQDSAINVKLVQPSLVLPGSGGTAGKSGYGNNESALKGVKIDERTVAQWAGSDEKGANVEQLGRDGKVEWVCHVPKQEKMELVLQWEVSAPEKVHVIGL